MLTSLLPVVDLGIEIRGAAEIHRSRRDESRAERRSHLVTTRREEQVMSQTFEIGVRELDRRSNDGIDVALLWNPRTDRLFVAVEDDRHGDSFELEVEAADALDAFRHPYAYARRRSDDFALAS